MRKKSFVTKDTLNNKKYDVVFNKKTGKAHLYDYHRFTFLCITWSYSDNIFPIIKKGKNEKYKNC